MKTTQASDAWTTCRFGSTLEQLIRSCNSAFTYHIYSGNQQCYEHCPSAQARARGRHSLHQVSRVPANSRPRHAAIFAYTEEAGVIGRLARTQQLFGRVLQAHVDAEEQRIRSDALID